MSKTSLVPLERVEQRILRLRSHNVMLDADLAALYEVPTGKLTRAVRRNLDRFPEDFMFRLTKEEVQNLRSQIGISSSWGGRRYLPYAFTEQGVAMLSSVLRSKRAVIVNIEIMRTFVRLRSVLASHSQLRQKLFELERKYDKQFQVVFEAIKRLIEAPSKTSPSIGFKVPRK